MDCFEFYLPDGDQEHQEYLGYKDEAGEFSFPNSYEESVVTTEPETELLKLLGTQTWEKQHLTIQLGRNDYCEFASENILYPDPDFLDSLEYIDDTVEQLKGDFIDHDAVHLKSDFVVSQRADHTEPRLSISHLSKDSLEVIIEAFDSNPTYVAEKNCCKGHDSESSLSVTPEIAKKTAKKRGRKMKPFDVSEAIELALTAKKPYKPHKQKQYKDAKPSTFCHICARKATNVKLVACSNIVNGMCRKVICHRCFEQLGWNFDQACDSFDWKCCHCTHSCPEKALCGSYRKTNIRRYVTGLQNKNTVQSNLI